MDLFLQCQLFIVWKIAYRFNIFNHTKRCVTIYDLQKNKNLNKSLCFSCKTLAAISRQHCQNLEQEKDWCRSRPITQQVRFSLILMARFFVIMYPVLPVRFYKGEFFFFKVGGQGDHLGPLLGAGTFPRIMTIPMFCFCIPFVHFFIKKK